MVAPYFPGGHSKHSLSDFAPGLSRYFPAGQSALQNSLTKPAASPYLPRGQSAQPSALKLTSLWKLLSEARGPVAPGLARDGRHDAGLRSQIFPGKPARLVVVAADRVAPHVRRRHERRRQPPPLLSLCCCEVYGAAEDEAASHDDGASSSSSPFALGHRVLPDGGRAGLEGLFSCGGALHAIWVYSVGASPRLWAADCW